MRWSSPSACRRNDALARDAGLETAAGGGTLVDTSCRTSNAHVFACGDCTSQRRPGQAAPTRLESWQNANEQGRTAAAAMPGAPLPAPAVPWFWTDQGKHNIQMLGLPASDLEYVRRGDPADDKVLWIGHRGSVPLHGVAINAGADLRAVRLSSNEGGPCSWRTFNWTPSICAHGPSRCRPTPRSPLNHLSKLRSFHVSIAGGHRHHECPKEPALGAVRLASGRHEQHPGLGLHQPGDL